MSSSHRSSNTLIHSKQHDRPARRVTELFVTATIVFFVSVVALSVLGVAAKLTFSDLKSSERTAEQLLSLHNITGTCFSVMVLAMLLPIQLPSRVSNFLSVRIPRETDKRQSVMSQIMTKFVVPLLDVNNDGSVQWFELWTGLVVWTYTVTLATSLVYFIYIDAATTRFIQLGAGMTRPVTTVLVKGYFASDVPKPVAKLEGKKSWLSWIDVNHDGRLTKIDMFCGGITLVYILLECSNTFRCLFFPTTRDILEQLIALPLLVVTLAALACFGPTEVNVPLFQVTAIIYLILIFWFVVRVAWGIEIEAIGGWLDCVLKVGVGMAGAIMQLVSTFLAKSIALPPAEQPLQKKD